MALESGGVSVRPWLPRGGFRPPGAAAGVWWVVGDGWWVGLAAC